MTVIEAVISGIVQGLTEFLPVSSSGHLVIFYTLTGRGGDANLAFSVLLHLATLLSVVIMFFGDVRMLAQELIAVFADIIKRRKHRKTPQRRLLLLLLAATAPAVLAGLGIKALGFDDILENIFVVAVMLAVTSVLMFCVDRFKRGRHTAKNAPAKSALAVGLVQAAAILPGLSRSGSTIFAGLLVGFRKDFAVRFAFLMSIPVILGAGLVEAAGIVNSGGPVIAPASMAAGFLAAMVCGVFAIKFIKALIKSNKFYIFGIYCLLASAFAFLLGFGVV